MTKKEIEHIIKRYPEIFPAVRSGVNRISFYIGNRKQVEEITEQVKTVCEIIEIIYEEETVVWVKKMIKGIRKGDSDISIMQNLYCSKSAYYTKKEAFIQKVFNCCIARNLVSFEEILSEKIA